MDPAARSTRRTRASSSPGVTITSRASCPANQSRLRRWRSSAGSNRLRTTTGPHGPPPSARRASTVSRTPLMVPRPASATTTTRSGRRRVARATASPSAACGDRIPPAVSTTPTAGGGVGQLISLTRSATVNDGRPRASAAIGGAIATGYHRAGGHTVSGSSPVAAARTAASVPVGGSVGSNDWAGFRAATVWPPAASRRSRPAATQVLPTSVPVPTTSTSRPGRDPVLAGTALAVTVLAGTGHVGADLRGGQGGEQLVDLAVGVGGRQRDPQPAGADRDGGWSDGGDPQPPGQQPGRGGDGALLCAEDHRDDRAGVAGGDPVDVAGEAGTEGGPLGGPD